MFTFKIVVAKLTPEKVKKNRLCTKSELKGIHEKMANTESIR